MSCTFFPFVPGFQQVTGSYQFVLDVGIQEVSILVSLEASMRNKEKTSHLWTLLVTAAIFFHNPVFF
jgi:hypothetical protein